MPRVSVFLFLPLARLNAFNTRRRLFCCRRGSHRWRCSAASATAPSAGDAAVLLLALR